MTTSPQAVAAHDLGGPSTTPGTLDLSQKLPGNPHLRAEVIEKRAACDRRGHPPGCHNSWSDTTYCRCGFVQYPGNCAPFPEQGLRSPTAGKPVTDPFWSGRVA